MWKIKKFANLASNNLIGSISHFQYFYYVVNRLVKLILTPVGFETERIQIFVD